MPDQLPLAPVFHYEAQARRLRDLRARIICGAAACEAKRKRYQKSGGAALDGMER